MNLQHTLPAGTERAYSAACFSPDGTKVAAVGSAPDYLLTLWDWAAGVHAVLSSTTVVKACGLTVEIVLTSSRLLKWVW